MKQHIAPLLAVALATLVLPGQIVRAHEGHDHSAPKTAEPAKPEKPKVKPYPLTTCIVTDEKLGEMGKPVVFEYKGQEIKLCCKSCRKDFDKDPAKFLKKLEPKK